MLVEISSCSTSCFLLRSTGRVLATFPLHFEFLSTNRRDAFHAEVFALCQTVFERSYPGVYTVWFPKYLQETTNVLVFLHKVTVGQNKETGVMIVG